MRFWVTGDYLHQPINQHLVIAISLRTHRRALPNRPPSKCSLSPSFPFSFSPGPSNRGCTPSPAPPCSSTSRIISLHPTRTTSKLDPTSSSCFSSSFSSFRPGHPLNAAPPAHQPGSHSSDPLAAPVAAAAAASTYKPELRLRGGGAGAAAMFDWRTLEPGAGRRA